MKVLEASLAQLRSALDSGETSSVRLVAAYFERIGAYDHHGQVLNAVPTLNPAAFAEARAADERRAAGTVLSELDGIPYTAKDSYKVAGLPVSAGSPAFEHLIAGEDAFSISRLREAGAICLGLTTMPPMANGGMQRGLHGRAESPYNAAFLTSAWASGSSNGSGTATASSFGAFGLGEETWSSGRAPANNNALCAYTPSWGVISMRGNWPLVPTMDVVVPHTRSMADMLALLDVMVANDPNPRGDFWRVQDAVQIPPSEQLRPTSYVDLLDGASLAGVRIGAPRMYLGRATADGEAGIETRASVVELADAAYSALRAAGAEVVECDFPLVPAYEGSHAFLGEGGGFQGGLEDLGFLPSGYGREELEDLCGWALDDFLRANAAGPLAAGPAQLGQVDASKVFPPAIGQIEDEYGEDFGMGDYVAYVEEHGAHGPSELPLINDGLRGLVRARKELFEDWMQREGLDAIAFPASADIAPADADQSPEGHAKAWSNGTWVANGNLVWRHLGIPTVTVPMGLAADARMPFGLTIAGAAGDDASLLALAVAAERVLPSRAVPASVPELDGVLAGLGQAPVPAAWPAAGPAAGLSLRASSAPFDGGAQGAGLETVRVVVSGAGSVAPFVSIDGVAASVVAAGEPGTDADSDSGEWLAQAQVPAAQRFHSQWRARYGHVIVAVAQGANGDNGALLVHGGC